MKGTEFLEKMSEIDPELIQDAEKSRRKMKFGKIAGLAAACVCILAGSLLAVKLYAGRGVVDQTADNDGTKPVNDAQQNYALSEAVYPESPRKVSSMDYIKSNGEWDMDAYDKDNAAWRDHYMTQQELGRGLSEKLAGFYEKIVGQTFSAYAGKNTICSPVNIYMALSMLCEITDGESRAQLLDLLGETDIEAVRETASRVFNSNYVDDEEMVIRLANSIWLGEPSSADLALVEKLSSEYFADVYSGDPADDKYNKALQDWLNEKTGGKLQDKISQVEMDPEMIISLVSALYFSGEWQYPFNADENEEGIFRGIGGDTDCTFMYKHTDDTYYYFDHFSAVRLLFSGNNYMWLILPDEGYTPEDIAAEPELTALLSDPCREWTDGSHSSYCEIFMKIPKFDVSSDIDLIPVLKELGVTDIFEENKGDFSPLLGENFPGEHLKIGKVQHAARVIIDEEGCTAAAFTLEELCGAAMPQESVEFTLDRPFLFAVTSFTQGLLFTGSVNSLY